MASNREIASKLPTLESSIYLIEKALFLSVCLHTNAYSTLGVAMIYNSSMVNLMLVPARLICLVLPVG